MGINPKRIKKWEKIRKTGKNKYIFIYCVLGWGGGVAISWTILMFFKVSSDRTLSKFISILIEALIMFPIGGYVLELISWCRSERAYEKYLKNQKRDTL